MDFRLVERIRDWMKTEGMMGDADVVSLAGAGKELLDEGAGRETLLKQIELSAKLHHATQVILLHHSDCGAYKAEYTFNSFDEEKARHAQDMAKEAEIIKGKFPEMEIIKVLAVMKDGEGKEVEFEKI
jgi:carbonic anhydrase